MVERLILMHSRARFLLSLALAVVAFVSTASAMKLLTRFVLSWNVGVLCWLALVVAMMNRVSAEETRYRSQRREPQAGWMLFVTVAAAVASLIAMALMLDKTTEWDPTATNLHMALSLVAVVASWLLTHTRFAIYYARLYYSPEEANTPEPYAQGLQFGGDGPFAYWDFMYFSFTVATTAATSDVNVTTSLMRRLVLLHAIVSFFFYTVILGLALNAVSNLI